MPKPSDYDGLTVEQLHERLVKAETACVMFGWSGATFSTPGGDATHEAWAEWLDLVGHDYGSPKAHPDLNEKRIHDLAEQRRATRDATLKSIEEGTWAR